VQLHMCKVSTCAALLWAAHEQPPSAVRIGPAESGSLACPAEPGPAEPASSAYPAEPGPAEPASPACPAGPGSLTCLPPEPCDSG